MTTPQPGPITILPPQKTKHGHIWRRRALIATIIAIALILTVSIVHHHANSFPTLHAQGKDPVLQLQALYNAPDHAADALKDGHNPHIKSAAYGSGMAIRTLYVDIDTTDPTDNKLTITIDKPNHLDNGNIGDTTALTGGDGPFVYLEQCQPATSPDSDKKWQRKTHMNKKQGIKLATHWVRTVLNTAANNW